ncbi:thioredoxin [bacterium]|nr:thioredoxin [bacterium]
MQELTQSEFGEKVEQAEKPVLVDFSADWCPPCKQLAPVIERISLEFSDKLDVYGVDTDTNMELSQRFNISGVPTMIFFREGKEVKKIVGYRDYDALKSEVESVI